MYDYTLIYFLKFIKSNEIENLLNLLDIYDELEYICKRKYGKELKKNNKTLIDNGLLNRTKLYVYFDN